MSKTVITILCENTAGIRYGVIGENGFSALVEKDGKKILFDTGQGMALLNNLNALGIDLKNLEAIVLSHGHYDHTTGLRDALSLTPGVDIIAHPDVFSKKYSKKQTQSGEKTSYIGMRFTQEYLEHNFKSRFQFHRDFFEICSGIYFSGEVTRKTDFEFSDPRLKVKNSDQLEDDPLADDISLLIETSHGPVILLGCAHAGVVNIMKHFEEIMGFDKYYGLIGGTHLKFLSHERQLETTMEALDKYDLELIAPAHCTGQQVAAIFYSRFGQRFSFAHAGWSIAL